MDRHRWRREPGYAKPRLKDPEVLPPADCVDRMSSCPLMACQACRARMWAEPPADDRASREKARRPFQALQEGETASMSLRPVPVSQVVRALRQRLRVGARAEA